MLHVRAVGVVEHQGLGLQTGYWRCCLWCCFDNGNGGFRLKVLRLLEGWEHEGSGEGGATCPCSCWTVGSWASG